MQPVNSRIDPAPSKWAYRFQRLMLTPFYRKLLRVGVPFTIAFTAGTVYFADQDNRDALNNAVADLRHQIETRPEFMVQLLAIEGASATVEEDIREIFPFEFPLSSFDLDLAQVRDIIAELPAVSDASLRLRKGGVLEASITERKPAVLWRTRDGLGIVARDGVVIGAAFDRAEHPDLPLVVGKGAERHVDEALTILRAAGPLQDRLRGLVYMGERRWDVVLDRGQRILLPESKPVQALERVIVLNQAQEVLERDLAAVDMRIATRPTIRMNENAVEEWWRINAVSVGAN